MMHTWYLQSGLEQAFSPLPFFIGIPFLIIFMVWVLGVKGYALWHAAKNEQKVWFVFLLIVNSAGILELVYLIWYRADRKAKVAEAPAPAPAPKVESET